MVVSAPIKVNGKKYIPMISFTSKTDAYNEVKIHEKRGIKGHVRKKGKRYYVYLPERL